MGKQLTNEQRAQILALKNAGFSTRQISSKMNVAQSTVVRTIQKHDKYSTFEHLGHNGRPSKLDFCLNKTILSLNKKIPNFH